MTKENYMEWQPIQTAPKDGTRIVLFREEWLECMCIGFWDSDFCQWKIVGGGTPFVFATHWINLPQHPKLDK